MLQELELSIKTRYTLIFVQTLEEDRFLNDIQKIAEKENYTIQIFNAAKQRDPVSFLENADKTNTPSIFVMQDLHRFLENKDMISITISRYLRNFKSQWKGKPKTIIITAPTVNLHEDLKNDFTVFYDELPDYDKIKNEIDTFLNRNQLGEFLNNLLIERISLSCLGLTIEQINKILAKTLLKNKRIDEKCIDIIIEEKKEIIRKYEILEFYHSKESIQNVGGLNNLKNWLRKRSKAFSREAKNYGLPTPKGLLILGVQGTGKSLTAKAVSSLWHLPLLRLDIGKVFGSFVGQSEQRIRESIKLAEAISPCILWIDELDKAFGGMDGPQGDSGTSARVFGTFLTWLQEKTKPVFVVATANDVSKIPPEMLRKGRFDEIFFVDLPNEYERFEIFKIHINKTGRDVQNYDLNRLTAASENYTGAEIEQAIIDAMYTAFEDDEREYTDDDIALALAETVPLSRFMKERIDYLRSWAENRARKASN